MQAKIVLVRPLYEENIGLVARAMANFGFGELALVKPECDFLGEKAKSRAMHGKQLLLKAKRFGSIKQATRGCSYAIATSARQGRNRNALSASEISERFGKGRAKIALVFGPEPSGLTNREIAECDFVARIAASSKYATLNLSHAVCIMLYQLFAAGKWKEKSFADARPGTKRRVLKAFEDDLRMLPSIDDKKTILASFKALSSRALLSEKEALALIAFFAETGKGLWRKGKQKD